MENYTQLCVWPGTSMGESTPKDLEEFFKENFNARVKYKCEVTTNPDLNEAGDPIPDTGGRTDLMFYVHSEDIGHFAMPRLQAGIRWWEDVVKYNDNSHLYSEQFLNDNPPTW